MIVIRRSDRNYFIHIFPIPPLTPDHHNPVFGADHHTLRPIILNWPVTVRTLFVEGPCSGWYCDMLEYGKANPTRALRSHIDIHLSP